MPPSKPRRFAETTTVSVERSMTELRVYLQKQGAQRIVVTELEDEGVVLTYFRFRDRHVRFTFPMAGLTAQEQRQRMRCALLVIKGKFESVHMEIEPVERAFMANLMLPDNTTVGDWLEPQVETIYREGAFPSLLPGSEAAPAIRALPPGRQVG